MSELSYYLFGGIIAVLVLWYFFNAQSSVRAPWQFD